MGDFCRCGIMKVTQTCCAQKLLGIENSASFHWRLSLLRIDPFLRCSLVWPPPVSGGSQHSLVSFLFCCLQEKSGGRAWSEELSWQIFAFSFQGYWAGLIGGAAMAWCWERWTRHQNSLYTCHEILTWDGPPLWEQISSKKKEVTSLFFLFIFFLCHNH